MAEGAAAGASAGGSTGGVGRWSLAPCAAADDAHPGGAAAHAA
eukprot:CAMPEP_0185163474 /NCGR_PEP_ID=MMETSP1139-20130426/8033_1 /TAXON_ID=298111 /ORGANISM="Pavlova sp., Strain CCMP459" /LENGTH=42 /DNA_ID= /DNA_START= /DNA_END= /DNA_ORIENTATION=